MLNRSVDRSVGNDCEFWRKTADSIEMPFIVVGRVSSRNDVLDEGSTPLW